MEAFTQHVGTTAPLMNDNIDTDQIIPKSFLKRIEKPDLVNFYLMNGAIYQIVPRIRRLR